VLIEKEMLMIIIILKSDIKENSHNEKDLENY